MAWGDAVKSSVILCNWSVVILPIYKEAGLKRHGRYLRGRAWGAMGFCTSSAVDRTGAGKEWLETVEIGLELGERGRGLAGLKVVHLSDLHCSRTVSEGYLSRCVERVNALEADIVLLTGDYVTHDFSGRFRGKAVEIIGGIESKYGVAACLGNHDYGVDGVVNPCRNRFLNKMMSGLEDAGVRVVKNGSAVFEVGGSAITVVGLGDLWAEDFDSAKAFAGVERDGAVIVLSHNPEGANELDGYDFDVMLAGHTHGVPLQFSRLRAKGLVNRHDYHRGMYHVGGKKLYVNRGLGRLGRTLFNARPEITVFELS